MMTTGSEIQTFAALQKALGRHGYNISHGPRVLDVIRSAAATPAATRPAGTSLGDVFIPAMREAAGPFGPNHAWLRPGDWDYAFKSHFDFVVQAPLGERHALHSLFALEFDGPTHEHDRVTRQRDLRKNRLCLASGLPLVRVDETFLHTRDRLTLIEWLAELWAAHRTEMPAMIAERDAEVAEMAAEDLDSVGMDLLLDRPDLDVNLLFRLEHPYPPLRRLAGRLARRYGLSWSEVNAAPEKPRWRVGSWVPAIPSLVGGLVETWTCEVELRGPAGQNLPVTGMVQLRTGYPISEEPMHDNWNAFFAGRLPFLPAGPFSAAATVLGEALCLHNTLIEIEHAIRSQAA